MGGVRSLGDWGKRGKTASDEAKQLQTLLLWSRDRPADGFKQSKLVLSSWWTDPVVFDKVSDGFLEISAPIWRADGEIEAVSSAWLFVRAAGDAVHTSAGSITGWGFQSLWQFTAHNFMMEVIILPMHSRLASAASYLHSNVALWVALPAKWWLMLTINSHIYHTGNEKPRICICKSSPVLLFVLFTGENGQSLSVWKLLIDLLHILSAGILPVGADKHAGCLCVVLFLAAGKYHVDSNLRMK